MFLTCSWSRHGYAFPPPWSFLCFIGSLRSAWGGICWGDGRKKGPLLGERQPDLGLEGSFGRLMWFGRREKHERRLGICGLRSDSSAHFSCQGF
ncbi:hypothetical protein F4821DRAFT_224491 [Hypoxylon rubiginosum]|uniref:Uncharacterized protein n=1 Tax=Hypoxylon rubiginosum TaxID=110542 RepID=A0ACC0DIN5_9PEZI|nr:hypothetical protein F4821DRAFT_224491 [Hypoxylon rubiginosum]